MSSHDWERRGSSFGTAAGAYAEHRPDYPADAALWCVAPVRRDTATGDMAGLRVLDLGAGTGKLTAVLVALGADVTAVEPDTAMLAELRRGLPGVRALDGTAEAIPLPDAAVDAVLCGQAMHWFDMNRAVPEIARVLVPGGVLGAMWNADDDRVEWVAGLAKATQGAGTPSFSRWRAVSDYFGQDQFSTSRFMPDERAEFANSATHTIDSYLALLATHSQVLVMEPAEREQVLARGRDYLASRPETANGEFEVPMVTSAVRTVRR